MFYVFSWKIRLSSHNFILFTPLITLEVYSGYAYIQYEIGTILLEKAISLKYVHDSCQNPGNIDKCMVQLSKGVRLLLLSPYFRIGIRIFQIPCGIFFELLDQIGLIFCINQNSVSVIFLQ